MPDWIAITPASLSELLSTSQNETIAARPHQGTALDPLHVAIADAIPRIRAAIRSNGMNRLSADPHKIPPELKATASTLSLLRLAEIWPLFQLPEAFEAAITEAENTLKAVSTAELPISLPAEPEAVPDVRRTAGVRIEHKRNDRLSAQRLKGL